MRIWFVLTYWAFFGIIISLKAMDPRATVVSPHTSGASSSLADAGDGFYHPDVIEQVSETALPNYIHSIRHPRELIPIFTACLAARKENQQVVGIFDIDHTLGDCTDRRLSEDVYAHNIAIRLTTIPEAQHMYHLASVFGDHFKLMSESRMRPLACDPENSMSALIKYLYSKGVLFLGATSRSAQYSDITAQKHLKECLDIDFDQTLKQLGIPNLEIAFDTSPQTIFSHAIAFCSGTPKAPIVQDVLSRLSIRDPLIVYVDDKAYHLEDMRKIFGASVTPVHLNTPDEPITTPDSPTLLQKTLRLPLDVRADIEKRTFSTLKNLFIGRSQERAAACEALIGEIFDQLQLPKSQRLSTEEMGHLVEEQFAETLSADDKATLTTICNAMQMRIKKAAPYFGFLTHGGKEYVAIYTAKQDKNHLLITESDGETLMYNDPIMFPVDLLYRCNKRYLRTKIRQAELPHRTLMRRTLSHADWPHDSPPSTPGPATPGLIHSGLFLSPKSPGKRTPPEG